jgi:hypothetical protein
MVNDGGLFTRILRSCYYYQDGWKLGLRKSICKYALFSDSRCSVKVMPSTFQAASGGGL